MNIFRRLAVAIGLTALTILGATTPAHALFNEPLPLGDWTNVSAPGAANGAGATLSLRYVGTQLVASGSTGCNQYSTQVTRQGEISMGFGSLQLTRMACDARSAAAEAAFVAAFENKTVAFDGSDTTLRLEAGGTWTFNRVGTAPLSPQLRGNWVLIPSESTVTGIGDQAARLTINADSTFRGTTACNYVMGNVIADTSAIRLLHVNTTFMLCDDARMAAERAYVGALSSVNTWSVDGSRLVLRMGSARLVYRSSLS